MSSTIPYEYRETLLSVQGVSLTIDQTPILRDVNLEIKNIHRPGLTQGQVVGLLGPSGIGKTCLFKILAGIDLPDSGTVLLENGKPVERGKVGVVAQNYPLFAHRTVLSNLLVAGQSAAMSGAAAKERALEVLQRFGLAEQAHKYPALLSGGQRQRVAIAQQFMCSDHFLLMDEPFSGLDPVAVARVCDFITEMAASDELKTFIVVTHDITAAIAVADTIWVLGRDRDAQGNIIPGARVKATYDLIERGVAWHQCECTSPECIALQHEIRALFPKL
ncbi:MAG TPA: ATP-binding cassette domain-containing protein [Armatimonadota bacterium]|jgi:polar amino acid transport system ATP-binding protein/sulfate transport system ATP-binding protein